MKSLTIRLPDELLHELETAASEGGTTVSSVVRDRVTSYKTRKNISVATLSLIADIAGSLGSTPVDMSSRTKHYLNKSGYGKKRAR